VRGVQDNADVKTIELLGYKPAVPRLDRIGFGDIDQLPRCYASLSDIHVGLDEVTFVVATCALIPAIRVLIPIFLLRSTNPRRDCPRGIPGLAKGRTRVRRSLFEWVDL
jgi:hypothetical protein